MWKSIHFGGIITATKAIAEVSTGILAERIGRKFSIMIALAFQLAGEIIFIFADRSLLFVLTPVIGGIGFAFLLSYFEAMIYDSLKKEGRKREMLGAVRIIIVQANRY